MNVTAEALSSTVIQVAWDDVLSQLQNGRIAGYKVRYRAIMFIAVNYC